jgi:hypothetical protein
MALINIGPHYRALSKLMPKCFAGPEYVAVPEPDPVIEPVPVLWWKFDNDLVDSKQGLVGQWVVEGEFIDGPVGKALYLHNDIFGEARIEVLQSVNGLSPCAWCLGDGIFSVRFLVNPYSDGNGPLLQIRSEPQPESEEMVFFDIKQVNLKLRLNFGDPLTIDTVDNVLVAGEWNDILYTYDAGIWHLFVNGIEKTLNSTHDPVRSSVNSDKLIIGFGYGGHIEYFDELKIYNDVISA